MSTRAHIKLVEHGNTIMMYRHCDGYPEETGKDLFAGAEAADWGDIEYMAADIIRVSKHRSFVPAVCVHGGEEYFYTVDCKAREIYVSRDEEKRGEELSATIKASA